MPVFQALHSVVNDLLCAFQEREENYQPYQESEILWRMLVRGLDLSYTVYSHYYEILVTQYAAYEDITGTSISQALPNR